MSASGSSRYVVEIRGKAFLGAQQIPHYYVKWSSSAVLEWVKCASVSVSDRLKDELEVRFALQEEVDTATSAKPNAGGAGGSRAKKDDIGKKQSRPPARRVLDFVDLESEELRADADFKSEEFRGESNKAGEYAPLKKMESFTAVKKEEFSPTMWDDEGDSYDSSFIDDRCESDISRYSTPGEPQASMRNKKKRKRIVIDDSSDSVTPQSSKPRQKKTKVDVVILGADDQSPTIKGSRAEKDDIGKKPQQAIEVVTLSD